MDFAFPTPTPSQGSLFTPLQPSRLTRSFNPSSSSGLTRAHPDAHQLHGNLDLRPNYRDGSVQLSISATSFPSALHTFPTLDKVALFPNLSQLPSLDLDGSTKCGSSSFGTQPRSSPPPLSTSICLVRSILSILPIGLLDKLQDQPSFMVQAPSSPPSASTQIRNPTLTTTLRCASKRQREPSQIDSEDDFEPKRKCGSPRAEPESPMWFVKMESPRTLSATRGQECSTSHSSCCSSTSGVEDSLGEMERRIHSFLDNISQKVHQQQHTSKADLDMLLVATFSETVCSCSQRRQFQNIDAEIDQVIQKSSSPCPDMNQLSSGLLAAQKESLDAVHDKLILHTLEELRFVSCNSASNANISTMALPQSQAFNKALIFLLYVFMCRFKRTIFLVDQQENRHLRHWAMSVFFRCMLHAPTRLCTSLPDAALLGKIGLAKLDAKQKKIPRDVVEAVLRPALQHFCQLKKLDLKLIVGLRSVVELFPTLFKEVFGKKILDTLESLADPKVLNETFDGLLPRDIRAMLVHMLDFFQLFASTNAFNCDQWISRIVTVVARLEDQFPPQVSASSESQGNEKCGNFCCQGFRAPLCRLMCIYPQKGVDVMLEASYCHSNPLHQKFAGIFRSIMKCKRAFPLCEEFKKRSAVFAGSSAIGSGLGSFVCSSQLSDVTLLVGPEKTIFKAHRVVLASKSTFFHQMFTNGFLETSKSEITLEDIEPEAFGIVIRHLYNDLPNLDDLSAHVVYHTYQEADRFGLSDLQTLCEHQLSAMLNSSNWRVVLDLAASCVCQSTSHSQTRVDVLSSALAVDRCGDADGGMLLRTCKAFILANLHELTDELSDSDTLIFDLLSTIPDLSE